MCRPICCLPVASWDRTDFLPCRASHHSWWVILFIANDVSKGQRQVWEDGSLNKELQNSVCGAMKPNILEDVHAEATATDNSQTTKECLSSIAANKCQVWMTCFFRSTFVLKRKIVSEWASLWPKAPRESPMVRLFQSHKAETLTRATETSTQLVRTESKHQGALQILWRYSSDSDSNWLIFCSHFDSG